MHQKMLFGSNMCPEQKQWCIVTTASSYIQGIRTLLHLVPNITYCSDSHSAANTLSVSPSAIERSFKMHGKIREALMSIPVMCRSERLTCSRKTKYSVDSILVPQSGLSTLPKVGSSRATQLNSVYLVNRKATNSGKFRVSLAWSLA